MHPAFMSWWKHAREHHHARGPHACGPDGGHGGPHAWFNGPGGRGHDDPFFGGGGPFGVRRPLRFLAHKLDLSEGQVAELARILDALKTERAQGDVDNRRTVAAFAEAMEGVSFAEPRAKDGGDQRVRSAERLRDAVIKALAEIHALLDEDQRKRFAYLIRTGVVAI